MLNMILKPITNHLKLFIMLYDIITLLNDRALLSDTNYYYLLDTLPNWATKPLFTSI